MKNRTEKGKCDTKLNIKGSIKKRPVLKFSILSCKENKAKFSKYLNSFCCDIKKLSRRSKHILFIEGERNQN
jgi:hypothetical protein